MNIGFVCIMGLSIVFIGLVCIVLLCKIMSILVVISEKSGNSASAAEDSKSVKIPVSGSAVAASASPDPGPRGEVVAAISAVLAEELGEDVSAIRILSLKKI